MCQAKEIGVFTSISNISVVTVEVIILKILIGVVNLLIYSCITLIYFLQFVYIMNGIL